MTQKTAIQELFEKYGHLLPNVKKKYLEKEKEQIKDAFNSAAKLGNYFVDIEDEEYYNETFLKQLKEK
jgi:hypothetical protein